MPDTSGQGRQHNGQHAKPYRHRQIDQIEDEDIGIDRLADAIAPGNGHLFGGAGQLADKYEQRDPHKAGRNFAMMGLRIGQMAPDAV